MAVVMQDSDYYIFDEPFNGVDIESNMIMSEMILHLKKQGKCIILSSHIFSTLKEICDSIYIIENGQISEEIFGDNFDNIEESYKLETLGNKIDLFFNEQIL